MNPLSIEMMLELPCLQYSHELLYRQPMQLAESARIDAAVSCAPLLGLFSLQKRIRSSRRLTELSETSTIMQRMWRRATIKRAVYISVAVLPDHDCSGTMAEIWRRQQQLKQQRSCLVPAMTMRILSQV